MDKIKAVPIKITNDGQHPARGTKLEIGGVPISALVDVHFKHRVGEIAKVEAEIRAIDEVEIELPAEVQITVVAINDSYEIEIDRSQSGKVVYRALRVERVKGLPVEITHDRP